MRLVILCLLLVGCTSERVQQTKPLTPAVALTHVNVVDVVSGSIIPDQTVIVAGNRIAAVLPGAGRVPRNAKTIDARGKYLIPGLWDMHVHLFRHNPRASNDQSWFPLFVANGVTGVRDMFTNLEDLPILQEWQRQFNDGRIAPRIPAAGQLVDGARPDWKGSLVAANPEPGRAHVRMIKDSGGDFVKVYSRLDRETFLAIADEAKKQNIPFAGHVPDIVRVAEASDLGQKSLEHTSGIDRDCDRSGRSFAEWREVRASGPGQYDRQVLAEYDPDRCRALFAKLARNGTWMTIDLVVGAAGREELRWSESPNLRFISDWIRADWLASRPAEGRRTEQLERRRGRDRLKAAIASGARSAGVSILAGTDVGNPNLVPGFSVHENLELMVSEAGFSPAEALRAATIDPARFLDMEASAGSVATGKMADLVLLDRNPLQDIRNTTSIIAVIQNGRFLDRASLNALLIEAERAASALKKPAS